MAVMFVHDDLFGGQGRVGVWDLWGDRELAPFRAVLACELAPGGRVGAHVQEAHAEIVIVTSGEGTIAVDGVPHAVTAGSVVALPLGRSLAISNGSDELPLTYIIVKAAVH